LLECSHGIVATDGLFWNGFEEKETGATIVTATDWKYNIVQRVCEAEAVRVAVCCSYTCTCHAAEKRGEAGFGRFGDIFWDVMRSAARRTRRDDAVDLKVVASVGLSLWKRVNLPVQVQPSPWRRAMKRLKAGETGGTGARLMAIRGHPIAYSGTAKRLVCAGRGRSKEWQSYQHHPLIIPIIESFFNLFSSLLLISSAALLRQSKRNRELFSFVQCAATPRSQKRD
jgi:hypothetical protein